MYYFQEWIGRLVFRRQKEYWYYLVGEHIGPSVDGLPKTLAETG